MADEEKNVSGLELDPKSRQMFLQGAVDTDMLAKVWSGLASLKGSQPITIFLNSDGGDLGIAWSIYDLITAQDNVVEIVVLGYACSAATVILQAADRRYITSNSYVMIHKGGFDMAPDISEDGYKVWMENALFYQNKMYDLYFERMNIPMGKLKKMLLKDCIYVGEQAVTVGLVDQIWPQR